ncbi:MAG: aminoacyl-tRNA hydrolase [bacterium]|nr:aminoacyl-tRNA hydrolase [bacterium]
MFKIIVGLGNPGEQYKTTRHNAGFMAIDALAKRLDLVWENSKKFSSEIAKNNEVILVKPLAYMNNSGQAVQAVLNFYKLLPKKNFLFKTTNSDLSQILTVIHDDLDIDFNKYKISIDSRSAGHNGVESIINYLKTKNFKRIRIGIKNSTLTKIPTEKFVLQNFNQEELVSLDKLIGEITNNFT